MSTHFCTLLAIVFAVHCATIEAATSAEVQPFGEQKLSSALQNRPAVVALVDGKGPFVFLLDTGTSQTVFSEALLTSLGATPSKRPAVVVSTASGSFSSQVFHVRDIATAGVTLDELDVVKSEIPRNLRADGILGTDFLANFTVEMNWSENKFRLYPFGALPDTTGFMRIQGKLDSRRLLIMAGRCRSTNCNVVLDTGALISIGNRALARLLPPSVDTQVAVDFLQVQGLQTSGIRAYSKLLTRLKLGALSRFDRRIVVADLPVFDKIDDPSTPTLFMGLDILGPGRLIIDYDKGDMYFKPRQ